MEETSRTRRKVKVIRMWEENNSQNNSVFKFQGQSRHQPKPECIGVNVYPQPGRDRCDGPTSRRTERRSRKSSQLKASPPVTYEEYRPKCQGAKDSQSKDDVNYKVKGKPHRIFSNQKRPNETEPKVINCLRQSGKPESSPQPHVIRCLLQTNDRAPLKIFAQVFQDEYLEPAFTQSNNKPIDYRAPKIYYNDDSSVSSRHRAYQSLRSSVTQYKSPRSSQNSASDKDSAWDTEHAQRTPRTLPDRSKQEEFSSRTESSNTSSKSVASRSGTPISPVRGSSADTDHTSRRLAHPRPCSRQMSTTSNCRHHTPDPSPRPRRRRSRRNIHNEQWMGFPSPTNPLVSRLVERKQQSQTCESPQTSYLIEGLPIVMETKAESKKPSPSPIRPECDDRTPESTRLDNLAGEAVPHEIRHRLTRKFCRNSPNQDGERAPAFTNTSPKRKLLKRCQYVQECSSSTESADHSSNNETHEYTWGSQHERRVRVFVCEGDPTIYSCGCYQPAHSKSVAKLNNLSSGQGKCRAVTTACRDDVTMANNRVLSQKRYRITPVEYVLTGVTNLLTLISSIVRVSFVLLIYAILLYILLVYIQLGATARLAIVFGVVLCFLCLIFHPTDLIIHLFAF